MSGRATGQFAGALVLCAMALVCRAEANWYKVEVLVFRQSFHSREQTQLRYAPAYPANVIALHPNRTAPQARTTARIAQERKPARPHAATANKPKLEPALSAQVAAAERAEETQRLNIEQIGRAHV